MENENENVEVDEIEDLPEVQEGEEDTTDYKAEALKYQGIAKRYKTKLEKMAEKPEVKPDAPEKEPKPNPEGLDYGQKAYLAANDIKAPKEVELVEAIMSDTGKSLEQVLESKYFQAEITEMREKAKTEVASNATAKSKRTSNSARDDVDYWIAKGELPEDVELARKVIAARRSKDEKGNPFRK
jgi:hypothetical protein